MTDRTVTDEQWATYGRREHDLYRRVREGTLPMDRVLDGMQDLIEGNFAEGSRTESCIIDCDADPFIPEGWSVVEHHKGGQLEFDLSKLKFHLEPEQQGGSIVGHELRKRLKSQSVMNANVLDYLVKHPDLIPERWKFDEQGRKRYIYFWGTIYRDSDGSLYVRFLCWNDGQWFWSSLWLGFRWVGRRPAAVLAS